MKKEIKRFILKNILKPLGYNLMRYQYRTFDRNLKFLNKKDLIGAEIGVSEGRHALDMMEELHIKKLYLIDPYKAYEEYYQSVENIDSTQQALDKRMKEAKKVLRKYGNKVEFIRKFSENATEHIKDESLDFLYIDGNHQYEFVKKDIELYYPKLKKGGIIGGHDYASCPETERQRFGVVKAVNEFFKKEKINFHNACWWVVATTSCLKNKKKQKK